MAKKQQTFQRAARKRKAQRLMRARAREEHAQEQAEETPEPQAAAKPAKTATNKAEPAADEE
jgi:hypothetical protein